jgi:hypothetical protein
MGRDAKEQTMMRVVGIESTDGNPDNGCQCCGAPCSKRRVVLMDDNGDFHKYGCVCADFALTGVRRSHGVAETAMRAEAERVERERRRAADAANAVRFDRLVSAVAADAPSVRPNLLAMRRAFVAGLLSDATVAMLRTHISLPACEVPAAA